MLSHLETLTLSEALLVAVSGVVVVFMMLAMLYLIIVVVSKIVSGIDAKAAASKPAPAAKAPAAAAPVATAVPAQDEDELVAVLMAAIAAESDSSPDSFRITNIQSR